MLKTVAVDLRSTFIKIHETDQSKIIDCLSALAETFPNVRFIVLVTANKEENETRLRGNNLDYFIVPITKRPVLAFFLRRLERLSVHLPRPLRQKTARGVAFLKQRAYYTPLSLQILGAEILFCPFLTSLYGISSIPVVCVLHDLVHLSSYHFLTEEEKAFHHRMFIDMDRRVTAWIVPSVLLQAAIMASGDKRRAPIHVIEGEGDGLTIKEDNGDKRKNALLERAGVQEKRYLIYPAPFLKHHNHEMLFTAFNIACRTTLPTDIKLICMGMGKERQAMLMTTVRQMGLIKRVIFLNGSIEERSILQAFSGGVVFPSLYESNLYPLYEAEAAGVPVACSHLVEMPEHIKSKCLLFDPRLPHSIVQAMVALLEDAHCQNKVHKATKRDPLILSTKKERAYAYWTIFNAVYEQNRSRIARNAYDKN